MGESLMVQSSPSLPVPDAGIVTRLATMDDLPFIDALQKMHSKQLGFFPRAQMEGYIANGWVLVAEKNDEVGTMNDEVNSVHRSSLVAHRSLLGYCASRDRYLKRDELGAVFQLCVVPGVQRKLIGATLLKNVFERASYGTRLFCCWCAQDLEANYFWEAMGFVPLAFRGGSAKRSRVHIFWERRIRAGDVSTPWWFPSQTNAGAIREDRIVLPIPPGTHWKDVMPVILPGNAECETRNAEPKALPGARSRESTTINHRASTIKSEAKRNIAMGGWGFAAVKAKLNLPGGLRPVLPVEVAAAKEKPKREKRPKAKVDPRMISAARELRDRWLEKVNDDPTVLESVGKYDVGRALPVDTPRAVGFGAGRQLLAA